MQYQSPEENFQYDTMGKLLSISKISEVSETIVPTLQVSHSARLEALWTQYGIGEMREPLVMRSRARFLDDKIHSDNIQSFAAFSGLVPVFKDAIPEASPYKESGGHRWRTAVTTYYEQITCYLKLHCGHEEARKMMNTYYKWTEALVGIGNLDPYLRAAGPNSTQAIKEAVSIANEFHTNSCSGYRGVICSAGSHHSVKTAHPFETYAVRLDPSTRQMDENELIRIIETAMPAILVLTLGRTDDGVVEVLSPKVKEVLAKHPYIIVLYDLTLYTPIALYPDMPLHSEDFLFKQKYEAAKSLSFDGPSMFVINPSKHYGVFNMSQLRFRNINNSKLRSIIKNHLRLPENETSNESESANDYVPGHGYFGTTTISALPAFQTVENIRNLGPHYLRLLILNACSIANDLGDMLKELSVDAIVHPVRLNALSIELKSDKEVSDARKYLSDNYRILTAKCKDVFPGMRFTIDLGSAFTPSALNKIANAVFDSIETAKGREPKCIETIEGMDKVIRSYKTDLRHVIASQDIYPSCIDEIPSLSEPVGLHADFEKRERLKEELLEACGIAWELHGIDTLYIGLAINALFKAQTDSFFSPSLSNGRRLLKEALNDKLKEDELDSLDMKIWKSIFRKIAEDCLKMSRFWKFSKEAIRQDQMLKFLESAVSKTAVLNESWIASGNPIPMYFEGRYEKR